MNYPPANNTHENSLRMGGKDRYPAFDGEGRELGMLTLSEGAALAEEEYSVPGAELSPATNTISIDPGEGPMEDRRGECAGCGCEGIHVDTTAGEILEFGEVVAHVDGPLLMADPTRMGWLYCEDCSNE